MRAAFWLIEALGFRTTLMTNQIWAMRLHWINLLRLFAVNYIKASI